MGYAVAVAVVVVLVLGGILYKNYFGKVQAVVDPVIKKVEDAVKNG